VEIQARNRESAQGCRGLRNDTGYRSSARLAQFSPSMRLGLAGGPQLRISALPVRQQPLRAATAALPEFGPAGRAQAASTY
jgi:hypothetical protein